MSADDKVKVLENEFKLIKSEVRQTLVSVRDFLMDLKLPLVKEDMPESENIAHTLPEGGKQPDEFNSPYQPEYNRPSLIPESLPISDAHSEPYYTPVQDPIPERDCDNFEPKTINEIDNQPDMEEKADEEELLDFDDDEITSGYIPGDEEEYIHNNVVREVKPLQKDSENIPASQINVLTNLMRWTAYARKEIGIEQLPVFLDVYSIGCKLPKQTKSAILYIANVVSDPDIEEEFVNKNQMINEQIALCMEIIGFSIDLPQGLKDRLKKLTDLILHQTGYAGKAEIWSQLMLELHGILTGNVNANQQYFDLESLIGVNEVIDDSDTEVIEEIEIEEDEPVNKTVKTAKLRLVFPSDDEGEQEIELGDLTIKSEETEKKGNGRKSIATKGN